MNTSPSVIDALTTWEAEALETCQLEKPVFFMTFTISKSQMKGIHLRKSPICHSSFFRNARGDEATLQALIINPYHNEAKIQGLVNERRSFPEGWLTHKQEKLRARGTNRGLEPPLIWISEKMSFDPLVTVRNLSSSSSHFSKLESTHLHPTGEASEQDMAPSPAQQLFRETSRNTAFPLIG
nr:hypothetical protein Iba_chr15bCG7490 [Ipomoea batatas]